MTAEELVADLKKAAIRPCWSDMSIAVPGDIKTRDEDFAVSEIPLYQPSGEGDHLFLEVEKRAMTTGAAVGKIARALNLNPGDIGVAGQKDALAVTTQWMSLEHVPSDAVDKLDIPGIRILRVSRHRNKLKMGHLQGNRFSIRLRNTLPDRLDVAIQLLNWLETNGMPNYFGDQRFGSRGDNWMVGRALLKGDYRLALSLVLGIPTPGLEGESVTRARTLFEAESWEAAADAWPRGFGENARLCRIFEKNGGHWKRTMLSVGKKSLTFYISAYQSYLFNQTLAERVAAGALKTMQVGDVAWKHDKGVCFVVESAEMETERALRGEISPSGPLYGRKMKWPSGKAGEYEQSVLSGEDVSLAQFEKKAPWTAPGGRRPMRVFPQNCSVQNGSDDFGDYLEFCFSLPSGAYATVLMNEICKTGMTAA
ncbi:MAG: tRNA pseudouridine(13) synthase TruD [Deltaproteobacteria bacterium]|nr:tRNA pseudouridine(13) synthase TruD [Deltaproteobacteria bacterium]